MDQTTSVKIILAAVYTLINLSHTDARTKLLGLTFGPMDIYMKTDGTVRHMEMDLAIHGNILYAEDNCLRTTTGLVTTTVFGNCTLPGNGADVDDGSTVWTGFISGFTQLNTTHIVYLDKSHQCLQILDRETGVSSRLVGDCDREGLRNGKDSLFSYPYSVRKSKHKWNSLVVVDWHNNAIREVDLDTLMTDTILESGLKMPQDATYTTDRKSLIITNMNYLSKYNFADKSSVNLTYTGFGHDDGDLKQAGFIYPYEIITLSSRYLLVAQYLDPPITKSRLRLVDLQTEQVASICTGNAATVNGDILKCELNQPFGLLRHGNTIYVGQKKAIRRIKVLAPWLPRVN